MKVRNTDRIQQNACKSLSSVLAAVVFHETHRRNYSLKYNQKISKFAIGCFTVNGRKTKTKNIVNRVSKRKQ